MITMTTKKTHSDATFYSKEGQPHFDVTPKVAKEMGLYYSVTEIQKIEASPGLDRWKLNTAIKTADENPCEADEDLKSYQSRIIKQMYDNNSATALGTKIHDAIENVLSGDKEREQVDKDLLPFVNPALDYFYDKGFEIVDLEKIVVNPQEAYAGTADVIAKTPKGQDFILDWKSTNTIPSTPYAQQPEQISAYAVAEFGYDRVMNGEIWGANFYISTSSIYKRGEHKGKAKFKVSSYRPEELAEAYKRFMIVNELFRIRTGYDPRIQNS